VTERAPRTFSAFPPVTEQLLLVGDRKAGLRPDASVPLSRLDAIDLIMPGRPNAIRAQVENAIRRAGYAYRCRFEAETVALCLELTRRGLGYTVTPSCALHDRLLHDEELTAAPIRSLAVTWALHINRAREHSVAVRALTTALRNFVVATIAAGEWRFAHVVGQSRRRRKPA
jgi:LysR family transcriptional regulator, nitrogen assimilation regulatory protein